ncbi:MAG: CHASE3 domain-containing protein [Labilithrix sp.]|nr:CHASE3 domain-containing protein [Labilithrix sp.]MCW5815423.1 CHASE3 domain-containing protein [Labilithrix sp.]
MAQSSGPSGGSGWTVGRKVALGFGLSFALLLVIGAIGYRSTDALIENNARVTHTHAVLERVATTLSLMKDCETGQRGFVITADPAYLAPYESASAALPGNFAELRRLINDNPQQLARLSQLETASQSRNATLERVIQERRTKGLEAAVSSVVSGDGKAQMDEARRIASDMENEERSLLARRTTAAEAGARDAKVMVGVGALIALVVITFAGTTITRTLGNQLGSAVASIRSSSSELQAAATQQASGSREQLSATTEVAATIRELLATSRQITESSQRVARIAEDTASGAGTGLQTMGGAREAIDAIRRQMDVVVAHMLALGKKSQEAGGILDLVNELAEQTHILAINATIEAAGAGESGRRFAVVADEIRKLADRVGGSTKEIRTIVDDMRGAVNTTVMATESTVKAVDAGTSRFAEVSTQLQKIAQLVGTSTEAAREIELSTKQQATAVEQVSSAIGNVAQATRESDASAKQTLQAASELSELSRALLRLVDATAT